MSSLNRNPNEAANDDLQPGRAGVAAAPHRFYEGGDREDDAQGSISLRDMRFLHAALRVWEIRNGLAD